MRRDVPCNLLERWWVIESWHIKSISIVILTNMEGASECAILHRDILVEIAVTSTCFPLAVVRSRENHQSQFISPGIIFSDRADTEIREPGLPCTLRNFFSNGDQGRCKENCIGDLLRRGPADIPGRGTSSGGVRRSGTRGPNCAEGRFRCGGTDAFGRLCMSEK